MNHTNALDMNYVRIVIKLVNYWLFSPKLDINFYFIQTASYH